MALHTLHFLIPRGFVLSHSLLAEHVRIIKPPLPFPILTLMRLFVSLQGSFCFAYEIYSTTPFTKIMNSHKDLFLLLHSGYAPLYYYRRRHTVSAARFSRFVYITTCSLFSFCPLAPPPGPPVGRLVYCVPLRCVLLFISNWCAFTPCCFNGPFVKSSQCFHAFLSICLPCF